MYEKLARCFLPVDVLLKELSESCRRELQFVADRPGIYPIKRLVTLDLVTNPKIVNVAKKYISKLLEEKEKYGYLYFLSAQRMLIPLQVRFNWSKVFVDSSDHYEIVAAMVKLADEFACKMTLLHEITAMEIYYFFIRLANPHLSWLAVESMNNCVPSHAHLIISPDRKFSVQTDESTTSCGSKKFIFPGTTY